MRWRVQQVSALRAVNKPSILVPTFRFQTQTRQFIIMERYFTRQCCRIVLLRLLIFCTVPLLIHSTLIPEEIPNSSGDGKQLCFKKHIIFAVYKFHLDTRACCLLRLQELKLVIRQQQNIRRRHRC